MKVADRIRTILAKKSWKQQQLADASGFTKSYISLILSGSINITLETVEILEKALNEPIIEVLK
jgi:transcriptional regulator with XRE-family HTH domain